MANKQHLALIKQGVDVWNNWREENPTLYPNLRSANLRSANLRGADLRRANLNGANLNGIDLSGANLYEAKLSGAKFFRADLSRADLSMVDLFRANLSRANLNGAFFFGALLSEADLSRAHLSGAKLFRANLSRANLNGAFLSEADLSEAWLRGADLSGAKLSGAKLRGTDLSGAKLSGAELSRAILVETNFSNADLDGCSIYGISAWEVNLNGTIQSNLVITPPGEPSITVDNLEVAQFVYLLLNNQKIHDVINTVTSKVVLILGRFIPKRKAILDALREELRRQDFLPILFDFDKPSSRNLTETVDTLAHMARFVIADITDAKSIPQELQRIVPGLPSVPVQPVILSSQYEYGMFKDLLDYSWVLMPYRYTSLEGLLNVLEEKVVVPAVRKAEEIEERRKELEKEITRR